VNENPIYTYFIEAKLVFFVILTKIQDTISENKMRLNTTYLSGEFSVRQAQSKVIKIKKIWIFPTGLEVHLEDMF
jgi:hypothetical protein